MRPKISFKRLQKATSARMARLQWFASEAGLFGNMSATIFSGLFGGSDTAVAVFALRYGVCKCVKCPKPQDDETPPT